MILVFVSSLNIRISCIRKIFRRLRRFIFYFKDIKILMKSFLGKLIVNLLV